MKPISLVISGWGPYGSVEFIDFTQFNNSIFLITGVTGAGKTTIFDGITYALYASVSGNFRKKDCLRSDYALDNVETFVELRFFHRGEEYVVKRNPSYMRKKLRGDGYTESKEEASLILPNSNIVVGNNEVNTKIVEILGITYEQYKKISMIAQGEFQTLLSERTDKRVEAFRNIFNTFIYNKLEDISGERAREIKSKIKENDTNIDGIISTMSIDKEKYIDCIEKRDYIEFSNKLNVEIKEDDEIIANYDKKLVQINNMSNDLISKLNTEEINDNNIKKADSLIKQNNELIYKLQEINHKKAELLNKYSEIEELKLKLFQAESGIKAFERISEAKSNIRKYSINYSDLSAQIDKLKDNVESNKKSIQLNTEYVLQLGEIDKKISDVTIKLNYLDNKKKIINNLNDKNMEIEITNENLKILQEQYENILNKKNMSKEELERLEDNYNKSLIGIVASKFLVDGEACPVCGSKHHPSVATLSTNVPTEEEIETKREIYEDIKAKCDDSYIRALEKKTECDILFEKYNELLVEHNLVNCILANEILKVTEEYNSEKKISNQLYEDRRNKELRNKEIEKSNKLIANYLDNIATLNSDLELINSKIIKNQETIYKNEEDIPKEFRDTTEISEYIYSNKALISNYEKDRESINSSYQELNTKIESNKAIIEELKSNIISNDSGEDRIILLKQELLKLNIEKEDINKNRDELLAKIKSNKLGIEKILKQYTINASLYEKYGVMGKIYNLFNGNNVNNIKLEHYIMSSYFDDMIMAANKRLEIMSGGIYKIFRVSKVTDGRKKDILELDVLDCQIGKRRPVTTLSGGEQFQVALSMALGMSDIIQSSAGGIEIDVLFIDEGFATLDSNARQLAIETLMNLTKDNISVGVISHVDELKERIDNQIQVIKGVNGSRVLMQ